MTSKGPKSGSRQRTKKLLITELSFKKTNRYFSSVSCFSLGFFCWLFVMDHQSRISTRNCESADLRSKILFLNEITMYLKFKNVNKYMTMLT